MNNSARIAVAAWAVSLSSLAGAHEFWLQPTPFTLSPGGSTTIGMFVGEQFEGERVAISPWHAAGIQVHAAGNRQGQVKMRVDSPEMRLTFNRVGTHIIAFDSAASMLTLSADKFHAYLHQEGLDAIIRQRERDGAAGTPGRERYRRNTKALVKVGRSDSGYAKRTGQRLEIVPLADPLSAAPGATLGFQLFFDGKPLSGALVKAWNRRGDQTLVVRAHSDADGSVRVTLPHAGAWMVSTVHMIPAIGSDETDWDSFWGNLTFELPARRK